MNDLNKALFHFLESIYFFEKQEKERYGLDWNEVYLLQLVSRTPGIKSIDLAKQMKEEKFVISRMVKKMEENGILRREPGVKDRRINYLYVTEQGSQMLKTLESYNEGIVKERLEQMSEEQSDFVVSMLYNMGDLLGISAEPKNSP